MRKFYKTIIVNSALECRAFKGGVKQFSPRSPAAVLTLPRSERFSLLWGLPRSRLFWPAEFSLFLLSPTLRKGLSAASIGIGLAAIAVYIAAVNAMLLDGEAMNRESQTLAKLEQDNAALQTLLIERQSPAQLQAYAFQNGMVAAAGVRYINSSQPVALSR